jgi:cobalt/nickel transport system permease protein
VVLLVQGLFFADGGLTALGTNITDMSLVTVIVGYGLVRLLIAVLPKTRTSLLAATFVGALLSVVGASIAFTVIYAIGGTTNVPIGTVATAMIGVHLLIGIGEALITTATVASILVVRPDLIRAARHLQPKLVLRQASQAQISQPSQISLPDQASQISRASQISQESVSAGSQP